MKKRSTKVLVRTAASPGIGAGHVARTSAVAKALTEMGATVKWACDVSTMPYLSSQRVSQDDVRILEHAATEGRSGEVELPPNAQRDDALRALPEAGSFQPDVVLLDSYLLGATWQRVAKDRGAWVAVFDDLMDRRIDADLIVNAAGSPDEYASLAPDTTLLCGLSFAVTTAEPTDVPSLEEPGSLLISFGAADPHDATSRTLLALEALRTKFPQFEAWVQLGAGARNRDSVSDLVKELGWARMLGPSDAIDARARGISLSIGAAGVSLYERMRDGIPSIVVPLAPNQSRIARAAESRGAALLAGSAEASASIALELRTSLPRLREMSAAGRAAIDGLGARRIADTIEACCG